MAEHRRYAVYYAPRPASALARFGAAWFGRDAERGPACGRLDLAGLPRPRAELVAEPRRYGFHGTLKAPFRMASGAEAAELEAATAALAAERAALSIPLGVRPLGRFLALAPVGPAPDIEALAGECVAGLDGFRAPPTAGELARRRAPGLDAREAAHLERWGYPYVFDRFTFHVTLTGPLDEPELWAARRVLAAALTPVLSAPVAIEDLCLFGEDAQGLFHMVSRHPLGGAGAATG